MNSREAQLAHFELLVDKLKTGDYFEYIAALSGFENMDLQNDDGNGLLHECVNLCNYPALLCTINRKANLNLQNRENLTPLHLAIWKGYLPLAAALLKAGADPNIHDNKGRVPLYFAVRRGDLQSLQLLLTFNANPNSRFKDMTMLSVAAKGGYAEAVKMLLDHHADPLEGQPLVDVLSSGNRLALAVLLENRTSDLIREFDGKILAWHAATMESSLLPMIAYMTKLEIDKMKMMNAKNIPKFPPAGLSRVQLGELNQGMKLRQTLPSTEPVAKAVKKVKLPWF